MKYLQISIKDLGVEIEISSFSADNGTKEWHAVLHVEPRGEMFQEQYRRIHLAECKLMDMPELQWFIDECLEPFGLNIDQL